MTATFAKVGSEWGVKVQVSARLVREGLVDQAYPQRGQQVTVTKRNGEVRVVTIRSVLETVHPRPSKGLDGYALCAIEDSRHGGERRGCCEDAPCCGCCS